MQVVSLVPLGDVVEAPTTSSATDAAAWHEEAAAAVREQALALVPVPVFPLSWRTDTELGPMLVALDAYEAPVLVAVVEVLDAVALVAVLDRAERARIAQADGDATLAHDAAVREDFDRFRGHVTREQGAPRAFVLAGRVTTEVHGAVSLLGTDLVQVLLVRDLPPATAAASAQVHATRGRRRGRSAAPDLTPAEQLRVVSGLVGAAELTLDGSDGEISAALSAQGLIEIGGETFDDPLTAARAQGRDASDGWAAWRFGPEGPYLGEALEEALHPQRRSAGRPSRRRAVRR